MNTVRLLATVSLFGLTFFVSSITQATAAQAAETKSKASSKLKKKAKNAKDPNAHLTQLHGFAHDAAQRSAAAESRSVEVSNRINALETRVSSVERDISELKVAISVLMPRGPAALAALPATSVPFQPTQGVVENQTRPLLSEGSSLLSSPAAAPVVVSGYESPLPGPDIYQHFELLFNDLILRFPNFGQLDSGMQQVVRTRAWEHYEQLVQQRVAPQYIAELLESFLVAEEQAMANQVTARDNRAYLALEPHTSAASQLPAPAVDLQAPAASALPIVPAMSPVTPGELVPYEAPDPGLEPAVQDTVGALLPQPTPDSASAMAAEPATPGTVPLEEGADTAQLPDGQGMATGAESATSEDAIQE